MALEYGYYLPKFGQRGFTRRDKEEVVIFLSYVEQEKEWNLEENEGYRKSSGKLVKKPKRIKIV